MSSTDAYYKFTDELDSKITTWILDGTSRGLGETATWPLTRLGDVRRYKCDFLVTSFKCPYTRVISCIQALMVCAAYLGFVFFVPSILKFLKIKLTLYPLLFSCASRAIAFAIYPM